MFTISFTSTLLVLSIAREGKNPLAQRSLKFENYQKAMVLQGTNLKALMNTESTNCAMLRSRTAQCKSYNYCKSRKCELNALDEYSENVKLESNLDCDYHGIRRNEGPFCEEKGVAKDIKEDIYPGACQINQKRTDAKWTKIQQYVAIDDENEWKKMEHRECFTASHGGNEVCTGNQTVMLEWYRLINEVKPFVDGVEACRQLNGVSFYRINGTDKQLKFFNELFNPRTCYWLGIERGDVSQAWKSVLSNTIAESLILWAPDQPTDHTGELYMCVFYDPAGLSVHDCGAHDKCKVVCDMYLP